MKKQTPKIKVITLEDIEGGDILTIIITQKEVLSAFSVETGKVYIPKIKNR